MNAPKRMTIQQIRAQLKTLSDALEEMAQDEMDYIDAVRDSKLGGSSSKNANDEDDYEDENVEKLESALDSLTDACAELADVRVHEPPKRRKPHGTPGGVTVVDFLP